MKTFNDLISKHNEKYNLEFKSMRSLLEAGLSKVDTKMSKDNKTYEENFSALKSSILEQKTQLSEHENTMKETINGIEQKLEDTNNQNKDYFNKFDLLSSTLDKYMKENLDLINTKQKEITEDLLKQFTEETDKIKINIRDNNDTNTKHFNDIDERVKDINDHLANNALQNIKGNISGSSEPNAVLIREYVDRLCSENLSPMKDIMKNYELTLNNTMNLKFEESKQRYSLEQKENMSKIIEIIEKKMAYLDSQLDIKIKEQNTIIDGRIQEYIVESEKRMKNDILKIKNDA
jgi:DNA-directed RNA polymerase subunit F